MSIQKLEQQDWKALTAIQVGGAVCLPIVLIGYELCKRVGLLSSIAAIGIGNSFLFGLSILASKMSQEEKKSTAENAALYFGHFGKMIIASFLAVSLSFWFAIQSQMMSQDVISLSSSEVPTAALAVLISLAIVISAISGVKSIERLATAAVPLMGATMVVALAIAWLQVGVLAPLEWRGIDAEGISLVMAACILAVIDLPTFFRHAACRRSALKASVATFFVAIPVIELFGALLCFVTKKPSLIEALFSIDNSVWRGWVGFFILLAGWTTNNANLYSAASSITSLKRGVTERRALLVLGAFVVIISGFNFIDKLTFFLDLIGVSIGSMGGVVLTAYYLDRQGYYRSNMFTFIIGCIAGLYCQHNKGFITAMPIVDALIIASALVATLKFEKIKGESTQWERV